MISVGRKPGIERRDGITKGRECTHDSKPLDAQHERVRGHVPRVGEGVFLPQLGKERLGSGQGGVVEDVVALEEEVEEAAWVS